jgi:hypothetical protein
VLAFHESPPEDVADIAIPAVRFLRSLFPYNDDHCAPPLLIERSFATPLYGGASDLYGRMSDGRFAYIDLKTQGTSDRYAHVPRPYDEWGEQLVAYADGDGKACDALINIIVSTTKPGVVVAHEWPDIPRLRGQWQCKLRYYQLTKNWWPLGKEYKA